MNTLKDRSCIRYNFSKTRNHSARTGKESVHHDDSPTTCPAKLEERSGKLEERGLGLVEGCIKKTIIFLIDGLWPLVRPVGICRYSVSCSQYAKLMLEQEPLSRALWLIVKRVASCNPFTKRTTKKWQESCFSSSSRSKLKV